VTAIGTDLWFEAITKIAASKMHHTKGLTDWRAYALFMVRWLTRIHRHDFAHAQRFCYLRWQFSKIVVAVDILITALSMLFQKQLHGLVKHLRISDAEHYKKWQPFLTVVAGAILSGLVLLDQLVLALWVK
jgi:hypothetical protein